MDRIDIHVEVSAVKYDKLSNEKIESESSKVIKERVERARELQKDRYRDFNFQCNSEIKENMMAEFCNLKRKI